MKTHLLDSDILIDFFKRRQEVVTLVEKLGEGDIAISSISVAELCAGWSEKEASIYLPQLYNIATVAPITQEIAELAGFYRYTYAKKGITLSLIDMCIAATTIVHSYCLVTRNRKDYPLPNLDMYPTID